MTSEIRTNSLKSRSGLSTVTLTDSGPIFSGITTFLDNSIFNVGNINATGIITATSFKLPDGSSVGGVESDAQFNTVGGTNSGDSFSGTDAIRNTLYGYDTGTAITSADRTTAVGYHALKTVSTNNFNSAFGDSSLRQTTGQRNNAFGNSAGVEVTSGTDNCFFGSESGAYCGSSARNTGVGNDSLYRVGLGGEGNYNTGVGYKALYDVRAGDNNTSLGYQSGDNINGSNNIVIGANADASSSSVSNEITLGDSNITKFRIPGLNFINDSGNIGQGTATPTTPNGSNADNPLNGTPVFTMYGDSPAINLVSSTTTSSDYSLINFGRTGSSTNPYRAVIGYKQSDDILRISAQSSIAFDTGGDINTNERLRITSSGTAVFGGNAAAPIVDNGELYYRGNSTSTFENLPQNFYLYSDDKAYNATNPGAGLLFGGTYQSGGGYTTFAGIHGIKENNTDNNYNSALVFGTRQMSSGTWERFRIDSTGRMTQNGTTSIDTGSALTLKNGFSSNDHTILEIMSDPNQLSMIYMGASDDRYQGQIRYKDNDHYMSFWTDQAERMRINSSGNVTVGTTNDDGGGSGGTDDGCVLRKDGLIASRMDGGGGVNSVGFTAKGLHTGGYTAFRTMSAQTQVGGITFNSGGTSFNTSSDYRRKENVVALTNAITRIKTLIPKRFNFISEPDVTRDGFLAHEVTTVPEAVNGTKDAVATAEDVKVNISENVGDPIYQELDQSKLVPLLTAALQESITKIEKLEEDNIALRARVTNLEGN